MHFRGSLLKLDALGAQIRPKMVKIKDEDGGDDGPHGAKKGKYGGGDMKASHSHDSNIQLTRCDNNDVVFSLLAA